MSGVADIRFEILNNRGGRDVAFSVLGRDGAAASTAADRILKELAAKAIAVDVTSSGLAERPVLAMHVDADRAADAGISAEAIAATLRVSTMGASGEDLPVFVDGSRRIPIRLQLSDEARDDLSVLKALRIPSRTGTPLPLSQFADIAFGTDVSTIERLNRERRIDIGFDVPEGVAPAKGSQPPDRSHAGLAGPVERSVDVHVSRIRQKIEADPREPVLLKTIRLGGYMFTAQVESA
ncbi:winged helix-turn-helix domain-containing protein [Consotaella aegiceratis]|uniref:winged helix-turn-helix domain-containing protein n=1 Tax=Consotaella aegiceratis TaxID=3097961 RepID=UPI002F3E6F2A